MYRARCGERAQGSHTLSRCHFPHMSPCSPTQLSECSLVRFWWRLHYKGTIDLITGQWWLNSSPERAGDRTPITWLAPLTTSPSPSIYFKTCLINITKDTFIILIIQKIPSVLGALCQTLDEGQICIYELQYHVSIDEVIYMIKSLPFPFPQRRHPGLKQSFLFSC